MNETETARWQGKVDQIQIEHGQHLTAHDLELEHIASMLAELNVSIRVMATKMTFFATIGSLIGGGLVNFISNLVSHAGK